MVSDKGIMTDPDKIEVIRTWPQPTTARDVKSFLGAAGQINTGKISGACTVSSVSSMRGIAYASFFVISLTFRKSTQNLVVFLFD
jgi:hypothetical protein